MRMLANENIPGLLVNRLRDRGHEVAWVREDSPGATDREVIARAITEHRTILTFDKDFGELAFRERYPLTAGIILLRFLPTPLNMLTDFVISVLDSRTDWANHFSVIEEKQLRMKPLKY